MHNTLVRHGLALTVLLSGACPAATQTASETPAAQGEAAVPEPQAVEVEVYTFASGTCEKGTVRISGDPVATVAKKKKKGKPTTLSMSACVVCNGAPVVGANISGILPAELELPANVGRELDVGLTGDDGCAVAALELSELDRETLRGVSMLITIGDANRSEVGRSRLEIVVE